MNSMRQSTFTPATVPLERKLLIFIVATLAGLGLLMVYSSSITSRPSFADQRAMTRQLVFLVVGIVAAAMASRRRVNFWYNAAYPLFGISVALLCLVLVPGVGATRNGAQRWFDLGAVSLQPSELAKLGLVLFLARALETKGATIREFWRGWLPLVAMGVSVSALVLAEPDFGTAVFVMAVTLVMLFAAGVPIAHMVVVVAAFVPIAAAFVWAQPYRIERIEQFIRAWSDPASAPYQVRQSLIAMGSGGIWGTGLGQGWQKLGFLPEANTDFVFAVIGEELGLIGTITVLGLWAVLLVCGVRLAKLASDDAFAYLASFGIVFQLVFQAVINVAVVTGTLPAKGISLPFISSGGSNLVVSLVSVGVLLSLTNTDRGAEATSPTIESPAMPSFASAKELQTGRV